MAVNEVLRLNVYNASGEVEKTAEARMIDLEFGTVRKLMELLRVDDLDDTMQLLETIYDAWDELTGILDQCFPEMSYSDWEHVKLKELVPLVISILKFSFSEILVIPKEKN